MEARIMGDGSSHFPFPNACEVLVGGYLKDDGHGLELRAGGVGHYGDLLHQSGLFLKVETPSSLVSGSEPVTLKGILVGNGLREAEIAQPGHLTDFPSTIKQRQAFRLPESNNPAETVFSEDLRQRLDAYSPDLLLGYTQVRIKGQAVGIINTTNKARLLGTLSDALRPWHVVIESPWSQADLSKFDTVVGDQRYSEIVLDQARYWGSDGRLHNCALLSWLPGDLEQELSALPVDSYELRSWITVVDDAIPSTRAQGDVA